jgi:hypothetical protein
VAAFGFALRDFAVSEAAVTGTGGIRLIEGEIEELSRRYLGAPEYAFRVRNIPITFHLPMEFLAEGAALERAKDRLRDGAPVWLKCYEANGLVLELYAPARDTKEGEIVPWERSQRLPGENDRALSWHGTRTILLGLSLPVWVLAAHLWLRRRRIRSLFPAAQSDPAGAARGSRRR